MTAAAQHINATFTLDEIFQFLQILNFKICNSSYSWELLTHDRLSNILTHAQIFQMG